MSAALLALGLAAVSPAVGSPPAGDLSVMSYNVHGLPWPFARGRPRALKAIGARLAAMRDQGDQPHLVLLQEAFTADAKAIAREAGYPFAVAGPGREDRSPVRPNHDEQRFARAAKMVKGEGDGTFEDSGLLVLSDYPVLSVKRMPYPRFACAGFDCLASKGVLMVKVAVPGAAEPLTVIDTHMNSRGASHVRGSRADTAYGWEAEQLRAFIRDNVSPGTPAIVAGDFNIGKIAYRRAMIIGGGGLLNGAQDALRTALAEDLDVHDRGDAEAIVSHGKDWMFARGGSLTKLRLQNVSVPFGREADGTSLSDHFGYVARYAIISPRQMISETRS